MIQPNQLRIGNLVDVPNKNQSPFRVDYFDDIKVYKQNGTYRCEPFGDIPAHPLTWDLEQCSGIPLTPEILEKVGFEKEERGSEERFDGVEIWWCKGTFSLYSEYSDAFIYATYTRYDGYGFKAGRMIKYLHELQNLYFAVEGEELQIQF